MSKKTKSKFKPEFYVKAYQLSLTGLTNERIAKALGVLPSTFRRWLDRDPALVEAVNSGRKGKGDDAPRWQDYVTGRMPESLRTLWEEILALDEEDNGVAQIEALLQDAGKRARQNLFIHALVAQNFQIGNACRLINISRDTFLKWKKDPDFADLIEMLRWARANFFEDHLAMLVKGKDTAATIFANRTFNRNRGYGDRTEVDVTQKVEITTKGVTIGDLDLDIETRRELLEKIRERKLMEDKTLDVTSEPV